MSTVLVLDLSLEWNLLWSDDGTALLTKAPYDVVMKTAEAELSCHMNIDLQYGTAIGSEV